MANLVDSNQEMLSVKQIIEIAAENTESPFPPQAVVQGLKAEMSQPDSLPMRYGNTIFLCHKGKGRNGFFRALNADTARNFVENGMRWVTAAYDAGFDFMVTEFSDPSLVNVFKAISKRPPRTNMGYQVRKMKDGNIQVVLQLGPKRQGDKA
jgi:hypothetical protein